VIQWFGNDVFCLNASLPPITVPVSAPLPLSLGSCQTFLECNLLTVDFDYVDCIDNRCACRTDRGFIGNATLLSPCTCPLNKQLAMINNTIFCIEIPAQPVTAPVTAPVAIPINPPTSITSPLPCVSDVDCFLATVDFNSVTCFLNQCTCRFDRGFQGNGTADSLCHCPLDKMLVLRDDAIWCLPRPGTVQPPSTISPPVSPGGCIGVMDCSSLTTVVPLNG